MIHSGFKSKKIGRVKKMAYGGGVNADMAGFSTYPRQANNVNTNFDYGSVAASTIGGLGTGAAVGGPVGAIVGGVVGLGAGLYTSATQQNAAIKESNAINRANTVNKANFDKSRMYNYNQGIGEDFNYYAKGGKIRKPRKTIPYYNIPNDPLLDVSNVDKDRVIALDVIKSYNKVGKHISSFNKGYDNVQKRLDNSMAYLGVPRTEDNIDSLSDVKHRGDSIQDKYGTLSDEYYNFSNQMHTPNPIENFMNYRTDREFAKGGKIDSREKVRAGLELLNKPRRTYDKTPTNTNKTNKNIKKFKIDESNILVLPNSSKAAPTTNYDIFENVANPYAQPNKAAPRQNIPPSSESRSLNPLGIAAGMGAWVNQGADIAGNILIGNPLSKEYYENIYNSVVDAPANVKDIMYTDDRERQAQEIVKGGLNTALGASGKFIGAGTKAIGRKAANKIGGKAGQYLDDVFGGTSKLYKDTKIPYNFNNNFESSKISNEAISSAKPIRATKGIKQYTPNSNYNPYDYANPADKITAKNRLLMGRDNRPLTIEPTDEIVTRVPIEKRYKDILVKEGKFNPNSKMLKEGDPNTIIEDNIRNSMNKYRNYNMVDDLNNMPLQAQKDLLKYDRALVKNELGTYTNVKKLKPDWISRQAKNLNKQANIKNRGAKAAQTRKANIDAKFNNKMADVDKRIAANKESLFKYNVQDFYNRHADNYTKYSNFDDFWNNVQSNQQLKGQVTMAIDQGFAKRGQIKKVGAGLEVKGKPGTDTIPMNIDGTPVKLDNKEIVVRDMQGNPVVISDDLGEADKYREALAKGGDTKRVAFMFAERAKQLNPNPSGNGRYTGGITPMPERKFNVEMSIDKRPKPPSSVTNNMYGRWGYDEYNIASPTSSFIKDSDIENRTAPTTASARSNYQRFVDNFNSGNINVNAQSVGQGANMLATTIGNINAAARLSKNRYPAYQTAGYVAQNVNANQPLYEQERSRIGRNTRNMSNAILSNTANSNTALSRLNQIRADELNQLSGVNAQQVADVNNITNSNIRGMNRVNLYNNQGVNQNNMGRFQDNINRTNTNLGLLGSTVAQSDAILENARRGEYDTETLQAIARSYGITLQGTSPEEIQQSFYNQMARTLQELKK